MAMIKFTQYWLDIVLYNYFNKTEWQQLKILILTVFKRIPECLVFSATNSSPFSNAMSNNYIIYIDNYTCFQK